MISHFFNSLRSFTKFPGPVRRAQLIFLRRKPPIQHPKYLTPVDASKGRPHNDWANEFQKTEP